MSNAFIHYKRFLSIFDSEAHKMRASFLFLKKKEMSNVIILTQVLI